MSSDLCAQCFEWIPENDVSFSRNDDVVCACCQKKRVSLALRATNALWSMSGILVISLAMLLLLVKPLLVRQSH